MLNKIINFFKAKANARKSRLAGDAEHALMIQEAEIKARSSKYLYLNSEQIDWLIQGAIARYINSARNDKADRIERNIRTLVNAQKLIDERERLMLAQERIFNFSMREAA